MWRATHTVDISSTKQKCFVYLKKKKKKAKEREKEEIEIRNMFLANIQENK